MMRAQVGSLILTAVIAYSSACSPPADVLPINVEMFVGRWNDAINFIVTDGARPTFAEFRLPERLSREAEFTHTFERGTIRMGAFTDDSGKLRQVRLGGEDTIGGQFLIELWQLMIVIVKPELSDAEFMELMLRLGIAAPTGSQAAQLVLPASPVNVSHAGIVYELLVRGDERTLILTAA